MITPVTIEPSGEALSVSVVLPTYNRERLLREAILSVWEQTMDPRTFEIVVVDNCSSDGTEAMVRELQQRSPCRLRYYRNETNVGAFASFDRAVELADAPIVASTDSDCRVGPDWLERGLASFTDEHIAFVSGRILDKPEQQVRFFSLRNGAGAGENPCYPAGNCFYRRSVYQALGGMRNQLSFGEYGRFTYGCGDTDLAWRMREAGYAHVYSNEVIVYHEVTDVTPFNWLMFHTRIFPLPFLIRRHPELRKIMLAWGPFFMIENAMFYAAVVGLVAAVLAHPLALLLAAPFVAWCVRSPGRRFTLWRVPVAIARLGFLSLRQAVICGSLLYGSIRARTVVL